MRTAAVFFLLLAFVSCGKRKKVIATEQSVGPDGGTYIVSTYSEHDSLFRETRSAGRLVSLLRCASEAELDDSTFTQTDFFPDHKPQAFRYYVHGKPNGTWTSWFQNGKKESVSNLHNGIVIEFWSYYDNGTIKATSQRAADGTLNRTEHFPDGKTKNIFAADSAGNGVYEAYYENGKMETTGKLFQFSPGGIWKRFDTAGKALGDTLYGLK